MQFQSGNKIWERRSSHGRAPIFESPEELKSACIEYFEYVEENPLYENKVFCSKGRIVEAEVPKMRAMTIAGLCIFLDICQKTWFNYAKKSDFLHVTKYVESVISTQKFEGAAADLFNANIIARDLGLRDHRSDELSGPNGGPIEHKKSEDLTDDELADIILRGSKDYNEAQESKI